MGCEFDLFVVMVALCTAHALKLGFDCMMNVLQFVIDVLGKDLCRDVDVSSVGDFALDLVLLAEIFVQEKRREFHCL